ncbi:tetratricopeptide repeat protein [Planotetraspora sp. A-T 1434]|uniref:tetratricopeptide repeat protein n=1 Tax=Planotetraspora sp. A-T 1434 TaxID=2979219 RepID=UPI0021BF35F8|nr:tetratricopeptide repeat protein [Planotetraspora sp. A-T 1434]MCT9932229.1 tetratricopeptide repeat protein [Planotetraspora sp. A-T 1434]
MITASDPLDDAVALHGQALAALDDRRYPDTVRLCRRALELFEEHAGPGHPDVANVLTLLGGAEDELGDHQAAEACHRRAVAVMRALPAESGILLRLRIQADLGLAGSLRRQGRYEEAEQLHLAALAEATPQYDAVELAPLHNDLGVLYKFAGRLDEAHACYMRALAVLEVAHGPGHPALAALWHNLAGLAHSRGDLEEGEEYARRSLALHREAFPPDHPAVVADEAHLGVLLQARGALADAEPLLRRAIGFFSERYGPEHYDVLVNLHNLAAVLGGQGSYGEAESLYLRALDGKRRTLGPDHPEVALTLNNLAILAAERGETGRASALAAQAHRILEVRAGPGHPALAGLASLAALY